MEKQKSETNIKSEKILKQLNELKKDKKYAEVYKGLSEMILAYKKKYGNLEWEHEKITKSKEKMTKSRKWRNLLAELQK